MASSKKLAVGLTIATALVFAAAFMPWGEVHGTPKVNSSYGARGPFGGSVFDTMQITLTITGWNGNITLGGLKLPNWLVALAAAAVAVLGWLRAGGVWMSPTFVPFALAGYGLLHSAFALVLLMGSEQGSAGIGSFITAATFVGMLVMLVRQPRWSVVESHAEPVV